MRSTYLRAFTFLIRQVEAFAFLIRQVDQSLWYTTMRSTYMRRRHVLAPMSNASTEMSSFG